MCRRMMECKEKNTVNNNYKINTSWPVWDSEHSCLLVGAHCVDVFKGQALQGRGEASWRGVMVKPKLMK